MGIVTINRLKSFAKNGSQVAFAKKSNARRYQGILRRKGYATGTLRSWGPTVDGGRKRVKSYYVVSQKVKRR